MRKDFWDRAKQAVNKQPVLPCVSTAELQEYIGASINTPMGEGRIDAVVYSHTRRVKGKAYGLYTLTITVDKQYTITTYDHTQWSIS